MIDSSLVILGRVFASKIIVVLTLHAIAALSQTIFIKLLELVARIFNTPRELRQYVKLAISQPTFWIDNLIGFGPNGVRQQTRARTRYCFSFIGAIAGYLALAVAAAYLAALYLGEQRLTAYESSLGISPCSYHVTEWGQSSSESHGLILGPFLVKANLSGWKGGATVAVLSNSALVDLHVSLSTSLPDANNESYVTLHGYFISVINITIFPGDNPFCDKVFDAIYIPGGSWSYRIGALGAFINTEPLNDGLTVSLWRSEAAGLDDNAQPLAERDTTARLQLGTPERGDEHIICYSMFKDPKGQAYFNKEDLKDAILTGDIAYTKDDVGWKKFVIAGLRTCKIPYGRGEV